MVIERDEMRMCVEAVSTMNRANNGLRVASKVELHDGDKLVGVPEWS